MRRSYRNTLDRTVLQVAGSTRERSFNEAQSNEKGRTGEEE
jgi:hypothetical protein